MNIIWNGTDKKINQLLEIYNKETGEEVKSFSETSYNYKVNRNQLCNFRNLNIEIIF